MNAIAHRIELDHGNTPPALPHRKTATRYNEGDKPVILSQPGDEANGRHHESQLNGGQDRAARDTQDSEAQTRQEENKRWGDYVDDSAFVADERLKGRDRAVKGWRLAPQGPLTKRLGIQLYWEEWFVIFSAFVLGFAIVLWAF